MKEKGFTLIELLAVITIMGILMVVAIPSVSRTIENTRRDSFLDTAKQYVNGVFYAIFEVAYIVLFIFKDKWIVLGFELVYHVYKTVFHVLFSIVKLVSYSVPCKFTWTVPLLK